MIGQEDGAGETAGDATADVDDANTQPPGQLLYVSHDEHLEEHRDDQLHEAERTSVILSCNM